MPPQPIERRERTPQVDDAGALSLTSRVPGVLWGLLAVGCGLLLTFWLYRIQARQWQAAQRDAVVAEAEKGLVQLRAKLRSAEQLLRSLQTMFLVSGTMDAPQFARMYANLDPRREFPSLLAVAYAVREHRPDGDHFPTTLVAPLDGNRNLLGLDVVGQPANMKALFASRDTDRLAVSAPFPLVQDREASGRGQGITLRLPDFGPGAALDSVAARQQRLRGSVAVSFRVADLIRTGLSPQLLQVARASVTDVTSASHVALFDSRGGVPDVKASIVYRLAFGGRLWDLVVSPMAAAGGPPLVQSVAPAGLLASVLLGLLVWSLTDTRRRAVQLGRRLGERYRESEERFRTLNELLPALVVLADAADGRIVYANQAARGRLGDGLEGNRLVSLLEVDEAEVERRLAHPEGGAIELVLRDTSGGRFWASVAMSWLTLDGRPQWAMVASDVTEQRALTELLEYQATHDELTGLINRREFERRLQQVSQQLRESPPYAAVLFIDLDQFKLVNDTSGHVAGDQLLSQLATVMRVRLGEEHVLARLGGDEFGVILTGLDTPAHAARIAEHLRLGLDGFVFVWESKSYMASISVGGVLIDRPGTPLAELLAAADTACYMAKEQGRNRVHFYSERDEQSAQRRGEMEWANRLRWAVQEQRFVLAYQEVRGLGSEPAGIDVELLLRFRGEDGTLVSPGAFIPAAERYGLMPLIDRWVIETALSNLDRLHPAGAALRTVAINLSGASIDDETLADRIIELLRLHRVAPGRVCFEITETVAVRQLTTVIRFVTRLREVGCRIALDDFGVGMSSFSYLKHLPADIIKIDGSFIRDMLSDPISHAMVRAVTDIAHRLGLVVIAEWVTDEAIMASLRELGVDMAQGYSLHQPERVMFQRD
ncbi:bifunctional diguanylate cyclase/phosphodiesterase [Frateuria terrea]|uniref:PAS domain S-box-containing protein/diguanylate cyclase (GGDEF) domain-containing protein n=1 Tax=Frateuria terrea TaxID=529704 RepID=A0A1H6QG06_9GAMM|nr:EAL domain-containing protein [Frateuria terrea]SEI37902.1 PAS domain S-box-containing protein/diguanylate cyclase (GGDEF) domain-containing protein [Frateuria terrea]SFP03422.1 PAS domain S-box-containing protein/diguanylate cyclase (GGDEF) domain-containing protein [Frateuria terrea]